MRTTGIGITEDGKQYEPIHNHIYTIDQSFPMMTAATMNPDGSYHIHAIEVGDTQTMTTEDHIHDLQTEV
jgi:hypothetical protein